MLATLVIGLREGLEAALIVGIIAAFLRRNGHSLKAMWAGVTVAVLLSIGVGVGLEVVSASLPQAQQEGMESIIGAIAIVFVTGMIVWMNTHARAMRRELESSAGAALKDGTSWALAAMAFLAVLKEGFETSVFLLATFQSSTNAATAAAGAVIGILIAVGLGIGLYHGGVRLNLGRFFTVTGVFLVFVAAGLVVSTLRTAHEAGWIVIGQQKTLDLSWLAPNGSIQAALVTGVLGIPADPRTIEVLGWLLYLVPVLLYCLWPASRRPSPARVPAVQFGVAAVLGAAAIALAVAVPLGSGVSMPARAPLAGGGTIALHTDAGSATAQVRRGGSRETLTFDASQRTSTQHAGLAVERWQRRDDAVPATRPHELGIDDLVALEGGRLPVGINAQSNPGPFVASWTRHSVHTIWSVDGRVLDARSTGTTVLRISGGGLPTPRTLTVAADTTDAADVWSVSDAFVTSTASRLTAAERAAEEALLWKLYLPAALMLAAGILAARGLRSRRRLAMPTRPAEATGATASGAPDPTPNPIPSSPTRSSSYAAK